MMKTTKVISAVRRHVRTFPVFLPILAMAAGLQGCHDVPEYKNTVDGNFEALWRMIDERYCYLDAKHINWDSIGVEYARRFKHEMTYGEYFELCADMLNELRDGHVNLSSAFNTSAYRKWWTDYPQDFNLRTLQQYYLKFDYRQVGSLMYRTMPGNIGYIYYGSFTSTVSESLMDNVLLEFKDCGCLIIDIRNNGGGDLTNISSFVARFIDEPYIGGYIRHKTGPGHNDFSKPYPIEYKPAPSGRVMWKRPVIVLTNRACFSAANDFVCVMKGLPGVIILGARTGGGGGMPFNDELPIGWTVRFSASPLTDREGRNIEDGIDPTPGYETHSPDLELSRGRDAILDRALEIGAAIGMAK